MKFKKSVKIFVGVIVVLGIIMALIGFNGQQIDKVVNWIIPILLGFILSAFISGWIENLTGDFFKYRYLSFNIWIFRVNIPLLLILTLIIRFWLFG